MSLPRTILHVDMDAFFASVEQRDDSALRGRPVLVGGAGRRGVVAAASYEARVFGCRSAMPMAVAKRLCPHAIIVQGSFAKYREASDQVFTILSRYSPLVEPVSIDEAFVDCTGSERLFGDGPTIARNIRTEIVAQTKLTASVGVAPNKFLAKLASDMNKPDGLTVITEHEIDTMLPTLPVGRIWGIGQKTVERLASAGVRTVGDLRKMDGEFLKRRFGALAERVGRLIHGIDDRPVVPDHDAKSIGQEQTFGENLTDPEELRAVLLSQSEQVGRRLRRARRLARVVTVKIRYGDFETITRRHTLTNATDLDVDLYREACRLFDEWAARSFRSVRLIGMSCSELTDQQQLDLFDAPRVEKQRKIDAALDAIKNRFGSTSIHRGEGGGRVRE